MVNRVHLIGHLGKDPELRKTPNDTPVATFSLATDEKHGKQKHTEPRAFIHTVIRLRDLRDLLARIW